MFKMLLELRCGLHLPVAGSRIKFAPIRPHALQHCDPACL